VLLIETALPRSKYKEVPRQEIFYRELTEKLAGIPGVLTAAGATTVPFGTADLFYTYALVGQPRNAAAESPAAFYYGVTPGYFRALGIPLRQGRLFIDRDGASGPPVAIVNETLSRKHWPGQNPIGKYLVVDHNDPAPREIVGVIGDVKRFGLDVEAKEEIYEPFRQHPERFLTLVLKTMGAPGGTARTAARMAHELEPDIPFYNVRTMEQQISKSVLQRKVAMSLLAVFACLALALAALGTYGVLSFAVSQRTREIGVRIALGALPSGIVCLVLKRGLLLAGAGIASGLFVAWMLSRLMENQLYQVGAADPVVYLTVVATIVLVALAACLAPARRAVRVDPVISLRYE
jgi:putative ABC transport system permease protein